MGRPVHALARKDDHLAFEIGPDQFDKDYLEHVVPVNGLGGFGLHSGDMFAQNARIVRFHLDGKHVVMIWPHERFLAKDGTPLATAVRESTADSVAALLPVVAENPATKGQLVDLSPLLGDTLDLGNQLSDAVDNPKNPLGGYRLDPTRTYFGATKAFPKNVIVEADETFSSSRPDAVNTVPDARYVQLKIKYNFTEILSTPGYMPRLYDDRVGFWEDPHIQFGDDAKRDNYLWYVLRWNVEPSDSTQKMSPAKNPIVFYLDNSIPLEYRQPVREGDPRVEQSLRADRHLQRHCGSRPAERPKLGSRRHPLQRRPLGHRCAERIRRGSADRLGSAHGRDLPRRRAARQQPRAQREVRRTLS